MSQVRYGQKGYDGVAMSKGARIAYLLGEKPLSKIKREDADALTALINTYAPEYAPAKPLTVAQAKEIFKRWGESSYHHTGKIEDISLAEHIERSHYIAHILQEHGFTTNVHTVAEED